MPSSFMVAAGHPYFLRISECTMLSVASREHAKLSWTKVARARAHVRYLLLKSVPSVCFPRYDPAGHWSLLSREPLATARFIESLRDPAFSKPTQDVGVFHGRSAM